MAQRQGLGPLQVHLTQKPQIRLAATRINSPSGAYLIAKVDLIEGLVIAANTAEYLDDVAAAFTQAASMIRQHDRKHGAQ